MKTASRSKRAKGMFVRTAIATVIAGSFTTNVFAQAPTDTPAGGASTPEESAGVMRLDTVEVTGSRVRRTDYETASPVQLIDRNAIERSGKQSVADVIRGISADGQGSIPESFSAGFASGSQAVSLRGLGVSSTLILVNGRRTAPYGLADDGSHVFTDLNTIPLEVVERIEVLKDGASAIYGSDAVGGVINIILRKDYEGGAVSGKYGSSYRRDGTTQGGYGTYGFGNLDRDGFNAYVTVEGNTTDRIRNADREDYLGTDDLRRFGWFDNRNGALQAGFPASAPFSRNSPNGYAGSVSTGRNLTPCVETLPARAATGPYPALAARCVTSFADYHDVQPEFDQFNVFSRGTWKLSNALQAYTELSFAKTETRANGTPSSFTFGNTYNPANPVNPVFPIVRPTLPVGHPDNKNADGTPGTTPLTFRYASLDAGGRNNDVSSFLNRYLVGLQGDLNADWSFDVGALYTHTRLENSRFNFPQLAPLQAALNRTVAPYRLNNRLANSPQDYASIYPTLNIVARTAVTLIDGHISGPLFALPAGPLTVAAGAEYRKETTDSPPIPGTDTGQVAGLGFSAFKSDRKVYAGYAELNAPVHPMVELSGAVRYDHYSDFGNSTTPKFGIKLKPLNWLALRGTYSRAFRAPGPTESGQSATLGFTNIAIVTTGDPSVKPERSTGYTAGIVAEPVKGTNLTLDYYNIKRTDEIVQADQAAIVGSNPTTGGPPNGSRPGNQPRSFLYFNEEGNLSAISGPYANANKTKTSGVDLDLLQKFNINGERFNADLSWTHVISFRKILNDGTESEYAGTHGPYVLSSASGTPQDRGVATLSWEKDLWTFAGSVNYVGPMRMIDHRGESLVDNGNGTFSTTTAEGAYVVSPGQPVCGVYAPDGRAPHNCNLASFTTVDLFAKWSATKQFDLLASVRNAGNRMAPFDPYTYGGFNYNAGFHQDGAVGRFYTVQAKYSFGGIGK